MHRLIQSIVLLSFNYTLCTFHELVIHTDNPVTFNVEIAKTLEEQTKGLMFREHLQKNHGVLISYESPRIIFMWMKNTQIPLDMIFIGPDNTISRIEENTAPFSYRIISSKRKVCSVLEINAGLSQQHQFKVGQKVSLKTIADQPHFS